MRPGTPNWQYRWRRFAIISPVTTCWTANFKDTLPGAPITELALPRLDGDLYESTRDALTALYPKLCSGGFAIVDDYYCIPGCKQAVDEYRDQHDIATPMKRIDWTAVFWRKA